MHQQCRYLPFSLRLEFYIYWWHFCCYFASNFSLVFVCIKSVTGCGIFIIVSCHQISALLGVMVPLIVFSESLELPLFLVCDIERRHQSIYHKVNFNNYPSYNWISHYVNRTQVILKPHTNIWVWCHTQAHEGAIWSYMYTCSYIIHLLFDSCSKSFTKLLKVVTALTVVWTGCNSCPPWALWQQFWILQMSRAVVRTLLNPLLKCGKSCKHLLWTIYFTGIFFSWLEVVWTSWCFPN